MRMKAGVAEEVGRIAGSVLGFFLRRSWMMQMIVPRTVTPMRTMPLIASGPMTLVVLGKKGEMSQVELCARFEWEGNGKGNRWERGNIYGEMELARSEGAEG